MGAAVGNIAKGVGTWQGKAIEEHGFMDEDVGKFEKQQIEDIRDYNRGLKAYDKEELWSSITDIGTSIASSYAQAGGGGEGFDWKTWGSTGGAEGGGRTTSELWKNFFNRPPSKVKDPGAYADYIDDLYS